MARAADPATWAFLLPWGLEHAGGVNQVVRSLYRQCEATGPFTPLAIVLDWAATRPVSSREQDCDCVRARIPAPVDHAFGWRQLVSYVVRLPATLWRLRKLVIERNIRVVNAHYPTTATLDFVLLRALRLFDGRVVLAFHGHDIRRAATATGITRFVWRWLLRHADAVTVVSSALRDEVARIEGPERAACSIVHNGVDLARAQVEALQGSTPGRDAGRGYLLNIGTYEPNKAQAVLVEAFASIASAFPDLDLVLIGRDGPAFADIVALADQRGLGERVRCLRDLPHEDALAWMRTCTAFVLPSRSEGLPLVILEAGALERAVVASSISGNAEIVRDGVHGLLVPRDDAPALAVALRRVLDDDALRSRLAGALHERVVREFTWDRAWRTYLELADRRSGNER